MSNSKPTNIDAQRILAIMDELKEKLTYLSVITPQVLEGLHAEEGGATGDMMGQEVMKQFQEQIRLEDLYMVANTNSEGNFTLDTENDEVREDEKLLQKNTLDLCRKMKGIPNVVAELRNFQESRPGAVIQFLKTLDDMQQLTLKRLTTTVEEEHSRQELLEHYQSHADEANKRKQQLVKDLGDIRRARESAQTQRTEQLNKLKADLQDLKEFTEGRMMQLRKHYEDRRNKHQEEFNAKQEEMLKRIQQLETENATKKNSNQEAEDHKRKGKARREMDVDHVIKDYDKNIREANYNINETAEAEAREQKQLKELKDHFGKVNAEHDAIAAEEAITQVRTSKMENERRKRYEAAALVQGFFKGLVQRQEFVDMKKKLRKGKKGKKGGKKK